MELTRRQLLRSAGVIAGASAMPIVFRGSAAFADVDPAAALRNRLVVIFLGGGNDGLNTVVPRGNVAGGARRDVYDSIRPFVNIPLTDVLPLDRTPADDAQQVGLNNRLSYLYSLYQADRLAVVQGVSYPGNSFSHFTSGDWYQSGTPGDSPDSGWLGRHLDRVGIADGELRGVSIGRDLPLLLQGKESAGRINSAVAIESIPGVRFGDGVDANVEFRTRHDKYATYKGYPTLEELGHYYGVRCSEARTLVTQMATVPAPAGTASYLANQLLTARSLLDSGFGVETVFLQHYGGFDTHTNQNATHPGLMTELDQGIEAFFNGTRGGVPTGNGPISADLASRTTVMVFSEFGRTHGDNGAGTDHGIAGPMFVVGPPQPAAGSGATRLVPGLHGDHPNMGSVATPSSYLTMTTDVRKVYQSMLNDWLSSPADPYYTAKGVTPLAGLFGAA
ncbi:MAG: hypothetical protein QOE45_1375 [Frankiaceae bacterium]|jgi:uncharacterized protein (DUF1501 family)|nr:hypothetical protein [Frankiaceae bacterium]